MVAKPISFAELCHMEILIFVIRSSTAPRNSAGRRRHPSAAILAALVITKMSSCYDYDPIQPNPGREELRLLGMNNVIN